MSQQKKKGGSANELLQSSGQKQKGSAQNNNESSGRKEKSVSVFEEEKKKNDSPETQAIQNESEIHYIDPQVVNPSEKNALENINTPIFDNSMWFNRTGQKKKASVYPTKRWGHTSVVYEKYLYVYGGCGKQSDSSKTMQVFILDCESYEWSKVDYTTDVIPDTRDSHTANIINHQMWIFGGSNSELLFNEFWTFDLQKNEWNNPTSLIKGEIPSPREGHASAVLYDRYLIIIGGFNSETEQIYQDVYVIDTKNKVSKNIGTIRMPVRESQSICVVDGNIYLFGGQGHNEEYYNDLHRLKIENIQKNPTLNVEEIKTKSEFVPSKRSSHQSIAFQNRYVFIIGGERGEIDSNNMLILNDIWVYDTRMNFWHEIKPKCQKGFLFKGRFSFSASVYRDKIIVYGGMQNQNSLLEDIMVLHLRDDYKQQLVECRNQCSMCDSIYNLTLHGKVLKNDLLQEKRQKDLQIHQNHAVNIHSQNSQLCSYHDIYQYENDQLQNQQNNMPFKILEDWRYTEDSLIKLPYTNSKIAKQYKYLSLDFIKTLANMISSPFQAIALLYNFLFSLSDQVNIEIQDNDNPSKTSLLLYQKKCGVNHKDFQKYISAFSHTRFLEFDKHNKEREPYMKENDRMITVSEFSNQIKIAGCRLGEQIILQSRHINTYSLGVINFKKQEKSLKSEENNSSTNNSEIESLDYSIDFYYYSYDELNKRFLTQDGEQMKKIVDNIIRSDQLDFSKDNTSQGLSIRINYLSQIKNIKSDSDSINSEFINEFVYDSTINDLKINIPQFNQSEQNTKLNQIIDYSFKSFSKYYYYQPLETKELLFNNEKLEFQNYHTNLKSLKCLSLVESSQYSPDLIQLGQINLYTFNHEKQEENECNLNGCLAYYNNQLVFRLGTETQIGYPSLFRIHNKLSENKQPFLVNGSLLLAEYLKPNLVYNQIENQFIDEVFQIKISNMIRNLTKSLKRKSENSIHNLETPVKKQIKSNDD